MMTAKKEFLLKQPRSKLPSRLLTESGLQDNWTKDMGPQNPGDIPGVCVGRVGFAAAKWWHEGGQKDNRPNLVLLQVNPRWPS